MLANQREDTSSARTPGAMAINTESHESAGKRLSDKTRKGNPYARRFLIQAAHAASRSKNTYLAAQYRRIAARRGTKKNDFIYLRFQEPMHTADSAQLVRSLLAQASASH